MDEPTARPVEDERVRDSPAILVYASDLYFTSRIESTAGHFGCRVVYAGEGESDLSAVAVSLVIVDLGMADSIEWISRFRARPENAGLAIVAFGSHVEAERLSAAKSAGADRALARSRFVQILPDLISDLTR